MTSSSVTETIVAAPKQGSVLSAYAPEFPKPPPDKFSLYLTFSNGFPLAEWQVFDFFNKLYPNNVVDVFVHKPGPMGKQSLFGKVTFKRPCFVDHVMGNHQKVSYCVEGRPMYCRRYVSNYKSKAAASATVRDGGE